MINSYVDIHRTWYDVDVGYKRIHEYLGCWQFYNGSKTAYFAGAQWQRVKSRIYDLLPDKFLVTFRSLFAFKQHAHAVYIRVLYINKYVYRQMVRPHRSYRWILDIIRRVTVGLRISLFAAAIPLSLPLGSWKTIAKFFLFFPRKKRPPTWVDIRPVLACVFRRQLNKFTDSVNDCSPIDSPWITYS